MQDHTTLDIDTDRLALTQALAEVADATNREKNDREQGEAVKEYGPSGRWWAAPRQELERVRAEVVARQTQRAAEAMGDLEREIAEREPVLLASIAAAKGLPARPLDRWLVEKGNQGHSGEEWLLSSIRAELVAARIDRELKSALPAAVLRAYQGAIAAGDLETVHHIEAKHAAGWAGPASDDDGERAAVVQLRRAIDAERERRVPAAYRELEQQYRAGRRMFQKVADLHQVRPRRRKVE